MASVGRRLGVFALVLAGTFGTAYAVGEALPGDSHDDAPHDDQHDDDQDDDAPHDMEVEP